MSLKGGGEYYIAPAGDWSSCGRGSTGGFGRGGMEKKIKSAAASVNTLVLSGGV